MKARKKMAVIDCYRFTGDAQGAIDWFQSLEGDAVLPPFWQQSKDQLGVLGQLSRTICNPGDYIIRLTHLGYIVAAGADFESEYELLDEVSLRGAGPVAAELDYLKHMQQEYKQNHSTRINELEQLLLNNPPA